MVFICPTVIDCCVERQFIDKSNLSEESKEILEEIDDALTQIAATKFPQTFINSNLNAKTDASLDTALVDLGWKKFGHGWSDWRKSNNVRQIKHTVTSNFSTVILGRDDLFTHYSLAEKWIGKAIRSRFLFSLDDSLAYIKSDEEAMNLMVDLKLNEGQAMPVSYNTNFTMDTDESFSRIFFNGIGAPLIAKQGDVAAEYADEFGPFVVDMPLQHLPTRDLYKGYGARVHFDENQQVTAIYDYVENELVKPGDGDGTKWEEVKMHAKVTCFTLCTVREHLTWSHLIVSNDATRESTLHLPPSHPIRRLLTIFTYRATEVNLEAFDMLVPKTSLLHRAVSVKYSGMLEIFDMSYTGSIAYQPFPEREIQSEAVKKLIDDGKFPYVSEGTEYYEIVRDLVRDWLDKAGDEASDVYDKNFYDAMQKASVGQTYVLPSMKNPDAMVNLLSTIIFTVTGYHELIGHVVDYTILPSRAGFRIAKKGKGDQTKIDTQAFLNAAIIGASTSKRMPALMGEYGNYIAAGGAPSWEREAWATFQDALAVQSKKVQGADEDRMSNSGNDVEFKYFDPARFECSISV